MNNSNLYPDKNYLEIQNNSEKYIEELKIHDKISVNQNDLTLSNNLIKTKNPLWGYYSVKSFKIDEKNFNSESIFPNYDIYCGDCFMGECYLKKIIKK
jgi:hypothetical protein